MPEHGDYAGAGRDVAVSGHHAAERAAAEPLDRRRRLLVPAPGQRQTAIMLDYDGQMFNNIITAPVHAVTLHGLINF